VNFWKLVLHELCCHVVGDLVDRDGVHGDHVDEPAGVEHA
jgi:hypothetical protein